MPVARRRARLRFRVTAELAAGRSDLVLLARLPKHSGQSQRGFVLQLPVLVWRDEHARPDTTFF